MPDNDQIKAILQKYIYKKKENRNVVSNHRKQQMKRYIKKRRDEEEDYADQENLLKIIHNIIKYKEYYPSPRIQEKYGLNINIINYLRKLTGKEVLTDKVIRLLNLKSNLPELIDRFKTEFKLTEQQEKINEMKKLIGDKNKVEANNTTIIKLQNELDELKLDHIDYDKISIDDLMRIMHSNRYNMDDKTIKIYDKIYIYIR